MTQTLINSSYLTKVVYFYVFKD